MRRAGYGAGLLAVALAVGCGGSGGEDDPPVRRTGSAPAEVSPRSGGSPGSAPPRDAGGGRPADGLPRAGASLKDVSPEMAERLRRAARRAQRVRPSVRLGCERYVPDGARAAELGPPPPEISAERDGTEVIVKYEIGSVPESVACSPFAVEIAVTDAARREIPTTAIIRAAGRGAVRLRTPARGRSLEVGARTRTLAGLPSDLVRTRVR